MIEPTELELTVPSAEEPLEESDKAELLDDVAAADSAVDVCDSSEVSDEASVSTEDTVFLSELSETEVSFRSPQPVRRKEQTAAHKKTVESLFVFIKTVLS